MTQHAENEALSGAELDRLIQVIAAERSREAFTLVFKHFAPRLKAFLMKSGLQPNTAEELAQETMLAVWRKASYFDPARAGAATWVFTIARNLRIDYLRRYRPMMAADDCLPEQADGAPSGEMILVAAEQEERVRSAMQSLSAEQSAVVKLSFFSGKAHSEIAKELDIPLGTVKSRVRLALNKLRSLLDDDR